MADLVLTGQGASASQIQTRIVQLRDAMDLRKEIWDRISDDKKRQWVASGKDPMMNLSWQVYRYLRDNFFDQEVDNGG